LTTEDQSEPDYKALYKRLVEEQLQKEAVNIEKREMRMLAEEALKSSLMVDDRFNAVVFVDHLLNSYPYGFITPMNDMGGDVVYRYDDTEGIFLDDGVPFAEKELETIMGEDTSTAMYSHVVKHLQVKTYTDPHDFEEVPEIVVLENGSFNIGSGKLGVHNPLYNAKNKLPVTYKASAECPLFLKFLEEVIPNNIMFFQEWLGYHLLKDYRFQRVVVFQGDGDNGKSTLLGVMAAFLGPQNISTENLYRLSSNRFSPAELHGKLANIAADIGPDELKHTGTIKMLTGGDYITAERKNRDPFQFRNYAKLTFSCNQLPKTPDETLAFFKRFIVIPFNEAIPREKQDPQLLEKLTTEEELSGIFNWAYQGLKRALERGRLAEPGDAVSRKELYMAMSDPVTGFYNEHIEINRECFETKEDLVNAFFQYCKNKGFVPPSDRTFYTQFKKLGRISDYRPTLYSDENPQGKQAASYKGIRLYGCQKSEYYTSKKEYQATDDTQTKLTGSKNSKDSEDSKDLLLSPHRENKKLEKEIKNGHYPHYPHYKQDEQLIKLAREYLKNNGGKAPTADLVMCLRDNGYEFNAFKRLKPYTLIFRIKNAQIELIENKEDDQ